MGKLAQVSAHYESLLKAKDATIAAERAANAHLQAAQNQSAPDVLDAEDHAAFSRATARFPDLAPKIALVAKAAPLISTGVTVVGIPTSVIIPPTAPIASPSAEHKSSAPPDPK